MLKRTWIASARSAIITLGCCVALMQQASSLASQVSGSPSGAKSLSPWEDTFVTVLVPGSARARADEKRVPAKTMSVRSPIGAYWISLITVADPTTGISYILPSAQFLVSTSTGMYALQFALSNLNVLAGHVGEPTAASGEAAAFAETAIVRLALSAPPDFFVRGSQPVAADVQAIDVQGGLLRLRLKNYAGIVGTFWVDPEEWKVTKTEFEGRVAASETTPRP